MSGKVVAGSASQGTIGGASPYAHGAAAAESSNSGSDGIELPSSVVDPADVPPAGVTSPGRALESDALQGTPAPARDGTHDPVNRPAHYTAHRSGVECIEISEHLCANLAQALQYVWRAPYKGRMQEDLAKARWFIVRECARRQAMAGTYLPTLDFELNARFFKVAAYEGPTEFGAFVSHIRRAHFGPVYDVGPLHWALDELTMMVIPGRRWWA